MRACLAGLLCVAGPALAADPAADEMSAPTRQDTMLGIVGPNVRTGVELRVGATYSDNATRAPSNKVNDTMATAGATVDVAHDGRLLDFTATGDIDRVEFLDDTFDGRFLGDMNATATLDFIPKRFYWVTTDTFGQLAGDPFSQPTPENLENVNYFTTGPVLEVGLSDQNRLQLAGTYSLTTYQDLPLDNNRYGGSAALIHQLSAQSAISLNVGAEKIEFDDLPNSDYDRRSAYLHYQLAGSRTGISLDGGYTEVKRPDGGKGNDGVLARLSLDRRISPSMAVSLFAVDQISDSADVFRGDSGRNSAPTVQQGYGIATADALELQSYGAAWAFSRSRTGLGITVSSDKETYQQTPILDRKVTRVQLNFSRRIGPVVSLGVEAQHSDQDFETTGQNDKELQISAILRWDVGRRAGIGLQLDRFDRNSNNEATSYDENRIGVNFYWRAYGAAQR